MESSNKPPIEYLKFNKWSQERIDQGRKFATSRTRIWNDPRVFFVVRIPLWLIINYFYEAEGADSGDELQRRINQIFRRKVDDSRMFYFHVGDFREK